MTTVDEAREALYNTAGYPMTPAEYRRRLDALIAAVRAEYKHWHTVAEYEAKLAESAQEWAALREAVERALNDPNRERSDARLRAALAATSAVLSPVLSDGSIITDAATPAEDGDPRTVREREEGIH